MKLRLRAAAGIAGLCILAAGCGSHSISSGTVVHKKHYAAHMKTVYVPTYTSYCHSGYSRHHYYRHCHNVQTGSTPEKQYVPAKYELYLRNKKRHGWISVSYRQYERAHVGQHWTAHI